MIKIVTILLCRRPSTSSRGLQKKLNGFTLIEILIALAVFAILATITTSVLYNAFTTRTPS